jgi:hypothetical protein
MFLIELTKPLDEINRLMKAHVQFLESGFRAGVFIAACRQQHALGASSSRAHAAGQNSTL